jgi:LmbE family N-acetylglucosaminyl deacetylase
MIECSLSNARRILCLGAHSDDIEIGCGGTLLKLAARRNIEVMWVVLSAEGVRSKEAQRSAKVFLRGLKEPTIVTKEFRTSFFPFQGEQIKEYFETLKSFQPDLIFTHYGKDQHQDHRVVSELTWNTFRSHLVLEYEIPKYDADLRSPNFFVALSESICRKKVRALMRFFESQRDKQWFSEDLFLGLMRLRGIEVASPTRYAEGFHCRKVLLGTV